MDNPTSLVHYFYEDKDLEKRYAGYMGKFDRYHCAEAEEMRERITGIEDSSAPGAMDF